MAPSPIVYALVARGTIVLAEYSSSDVTTNANLIAVRILEKLGPEDTRVSYTQDQHMFHVLVSDGIAFICMAEQVCDGGHMPA